MAPFDQYRFPYAPAPKSFDGRPRWYSGVMSAKTPKPHELSYPTLSPDTDPAAEAVQLEIYRRMPAGQKIRLTVEATDWNRAAVSAGLRQRYPDADEAEIRRRLYGLTLGEELATKVYGPVTGSEPPDHHGRR